MVRLAERRKELLDSMMREAVYEGAVAVLTQFGLNGTTMDRVAAAAGIAKGSSVQPLSQQAGAFGVRA
jgi:AcrR family transcriptional regulator